MSKRISVRIPDDLHRWLTERAKAERRTLSNALVLLLEDQRIREEQLSVPHATGLLQKDKDSAS